VGRCDGIEEPCPFPHSYPVTGKFSLGRAGPSTDFTGIPEFCKSALPGHPAGQRNRQRPPEWRLPYGQ